MRISGILWTLAVALIPLAAHAQEPPTPAPAPAAAASPSSPWSGAIDFGVRGTDLKGDGARYER
jgi:hypothetical protein